MKRTILLTFLLALLAGSAFAANSPAVAFTFACNGKATGFCPDGAGANFLLQASDGNFYGTAPYSGDKAGGFTLFGGTIFSITPTGKFALLHTFLPGPNNNFPNGTDPISLTEGPDGKLYGLTLDGGNGFNSSDNFLGYGVVFRISKNGSAFQVIHKFCSVGVYCSDGNYPTGPLVVGSDGNLYGVTYEGGAGVGCAAGGCGTIFRVTPSSGAYEVIFSFGSSSGGGFPSGLIAASDGTFYGLSSGGLYHYTPTTGTLQLTALPFGISSQCPGLACFATTVYALGPNGNFYGFYTVYASTATGLYEVQLDGGDFQFLPPLSSGIGNELLLGSDGNFWFSQNAGNGGNGDIVSISPEATVLQTLTPFGKSAPVGTSPSWLIQSTNGTLWGTTMGGGTVSKGRGSGTVYSLDLGLPPAR